MTRDKGLASALTSTFCFTWESHEIIKGERSGRTLLPSCSSLNQTVPSWKLSWIMFWVTLHTEERLLHNEGSILHVQLWSRPSWPTGLLPLHHPVFCVFISLFIYLPKVLSESWGTPSSTILHIVWVPATVILNWISNSTTKQFQSVDTALVVFLLKQLELSHSTVLFCFVFW